MDGVIRLKGVTSFPVTPNPPSGRFYVGVDAVDGALKKQDSSGVVVNYDSGAAYTDEQAQDAVGNILTDTASVDLAYNDAANQITATVLPAGVNHNLLGNYVANQHVDHSSVSISTPVDGGLSGGGNLTATRTLSLAIDALPDQSRAQIGDKALIFDPVAGVHKRIEFYRLQRAYPDRYIFTYSDFIQNTLGDLTATVSGTGASAQAGTYGIDLTEQAQGVLQIDTGTTATGRAFVGTASINHLWVASGNILRFGARLAPELLSTNVETFVLHAGFLDNTAAGEPTDGCYFRYTDSVNGGRYEAVVSAAGVRQAFDTGVLASLNYQIFEVFIDYTAVNPVVTFYIDGALTNTVNVPSPIPVGPTQAFGYAWRIEKTVGTSQRNLSADWFYFSLDRNAAR